MSIRENYERICDAIQNAAVDSSRKYEDITLIAVTKFVPIERIAEAIDAGVSSVGENRVQELLQKLDFFNSLKIDVNLIGQLQTNKVKYIKGAVKFIQSIDRMELAKELDKRCTKENLVQKVLVEVNIGEEEQKGGIEPPALRDFLSELAGMSGIAVEGLMCIPPAVEPEEARKYFARMRRLFEDMKSVDGVSMQHLSMGMSSDYQEAILEGATMIRVGTALFGKRS